MVSRVTVAILLSEVIAVRQQLARVPLLRQWVPRMTPDHVSCLVPRINATGRQAGRQTDRQTDRHTQARKLLFAHARECSPAPPADCLTAIPSHPAHLPFSKPLSLSYILMLSFHFLFGLPRVFPTSICMHFLCLLSQPSQPHDLDREHQSIHGMKQYTDDTTSRVTWSTDRL
jgi:hypothetical protein